MRSYLVPVYATYLVATVGRLHALGSWKSSPPDWGRATRSDDSL